MLFSGFLGCKHVSIVALMYCLLLMKVTNKKKEGKKIKMHLGVVEVERLSS